MIAAEWQKVENKLSMPYSIVGLNIDGYIVSISTEKISNLKYGYMVYVDGKFNYKWALEDTDIRKRFYQKHKKNLISNKELKELKKIRKSFDKKTANDDKLVYSYYTPYWTSFRSLKLHFIKNNKLIELR